MAKKTKAVSKGSKVKKNGRPKANAVAQPKAVKAKAAPKVEVKVVAAAPTRQIEAARAALKREKTAKTEVPVVVTVPKTKTRGRRIAVDINPNEAAGALAQKWNALYKKSEQIQSKPYNMKAVFEEKTAIVHKVLGWGYILANRNDRLEVLFQDGIKYLISNYKS